MNVGTQSFGHHFSSLTGHSPMRWQQRLFDLLVRGEIPVALDLPTGLGKTSVMAVWLVARAVAGEDALKTIPRRLVYIVDRRAVVDQATEEAEKLRLALNGDAKFLKRALGLGDRSLPISTLRGAFVDNREWCADPASTAIVVGTVDMIGSRLLFRGYGVSRKMRPYHAGLLGVDALIVLDEAHLVPPFEALLRQIENGKRAFGPRAESDAAILPSFRLLPLSATGRSRSTSNGEVAEDAFQLDDDDFQDEIVRKRLDARKTLRCIAIDDKRDALAEALSQEAWRLSENGAKPVRCLVYCESRTVAEKVKTNLDNLAAAQNNSTGTKAETELFVGARRVRERQAARSWLGKHGFLAGSSPPTVPTFLIATSAGEVGVDMDADHMVCDLVAWERMVQRMGRVNRRGTGDASITIIHSDEPRQKKPDAPTDQEVRQAISYGSLAVVAELPGSEGRGDASPRALRELKLRARLDPALSAKIDAATTPEPLRPALTRALVDAWSMTSLEDHPARPEIAPWLRGWEEEEPQTTLIWRRHLPVRTGADGKPVSASKKEVESFFEAAPAHASEKLETETHRVVEWLMVRGKSFLASGAAEAGETAKVGFESAGDDDTPTVEAAWGALPNPLRRADIVVYVLSPAGDYKKSFTLDKLADEGVKALREELKTALAGATLIADARLGGLDSGVLSASACGPIETADADEEWSRQTGFRVRSAVRGATVEDDGWRVSHHFVLRSDENGEPMELLSVEHFRDAALSEDGRSISKLQELAPHQSLAQRQVRRIAQSIGLSADIVEALAVAASLHDEGKKAPNWQRAFEAPREWDEGGARKIFAKTPGPIRQKILNGYRHEFGSLPYVEAQDCFNALPEDWRDLVLHLIAAHHGQARPVIATSGCPDAPGSALDERAEAVALRFARLQRRWGPWGLAWWEALLRAADQQASRDYEASGDNSARNSEGG